ncbi:hypothetical protein RCL_jg14727.t1 [Rhizophagus clarus]|uniref:Uncharacterized protein n=1 Tax=Rhizophagus clarus TaxID=94130 RepID=A0A8H3M2C9_9GLOM|nr:hypothetical protein RCL_jg14727.t1 [Rhizophagus clarus]
MTLHLRLIYCKSLFTCCGSLFQESSAILEKSPIRAFGTIFGLLSEERAFFIRSSMVKVGGKGGLMIMLLFGQLLIILVSLLKLKLELIIRLFRFLFFEDS